MNIFRRLKLYIFLPVGMLFFVVFVLFLPTKTAASVVSEIHNNLLRPAELTFMDFLNSFQSHAIPPFQNHNDVIHVSDIEPAAGSEETPKEPTQFRFELEDRELKTDSVLVAARQVVISSSRDDKIKDIYVHNGDFFQKGDLLVEYVCADIKGEQKLLEAQSGLIKTKIKSSFRLLKLGMLSDIEMQQMDTEKIQAEVQSEILAEEMTDCLIRAPFDGRVTNRLANAQEYTRTDRVLIEIAETESMNVQFVVPSRWLRWINVGAPLSVYIEDMDQSYDGKIIRIHGEIDPVSETIQVVGQIETDGDNLYLGMSGIVSIDAHEIRDANIIGILEEKNGR